MSTKQSPQIIPVSPTIYVPDKWLPEELDRIFHERKSILSKKVKGVLQYLDRSMPGAEDAVRELLERLSATLVIESNLHLTVFRGQESLQNFSDRNPVEDYGWVGWKVVTTAGVNFIVDAFQNSVELEIMKYHGLGTGSGAEAIGDTALGTELTTEYTGDVRATGSLTEGATANVFRSVGTNTLDGTPGAALREHGIFSASTGGTLLDRTVYSAITLSSGDSLQSTYDLTCTAGG